MDHDVSVPVQRHPNFEMSVSCSRSSSPAISEGLNCAVPRQVIYDTEKVVSVSEPLSGVKLKHG
jgi:hypothetical protein